VKLHVLAAFAALSLVSLSACGGGGSTAIVPTAGAPTANLVPLTAKTVVTAVYGKKPLPNILITLWKCAEPCSFPPKFLGKLSAGKTGAKGRVGLHGNWTKSMWVCAVGTYNHNDGTWCEKPFPPTLKVNFKF
jgi:hypothetical protein